MPDQQIRKWQWRMAEQRAFCDIYRLRLSNAVAVFVAAAFQVRFRAFS
jgi:hypothetical protein